MISTRALALYNTLVIAANLVTLGTSPMTPTRATFGVLAITCSLVVFVLIYRARRPRAVVDAPPARAIERTIKAREVREGQTVTRVVSHYPSNTWGRRRTISVDQEVEKVRGQWPTVVESDYWERGEGGTPTVYLTLSDDEGMAFCLGPDDDVTVLEASR